MVYNIKTTILMAMWLLKQIPVPTTWDRGTFKKSRNDLSLIFQYCMLRTCCAIELWAESEAFWNERMQQLRCVDLDFETSHLSAGGQRDPFSSIFLRQCSPHQLHNILVHATQECLTVPEIQEVPHFHIGGRSLRPADGFEGINRRLLRQHLE